MMGDPGLEPGTSSLSGKPDVPSSRPNSHLIPAKRPNSTCGRGLERTGGYKLVAPSWPTAAVRGQGVVLPGSGHDADDTVKPGRSGGGPLRAQSRRRRQAAVRPRARPSRDPSVSIGERATATELARDIQPSACHAASTASLAFRPRRRGHIANGQTAFVGIMGFLDTGTHIWKTIDGGVNWTAFGSTANGLPDAPVNALLVDSSVNPSQVYAGTDVGVFVEFGHCARWSEVGPNAQPGAVGYLPNVAVTAMRLFNNAGTKRLRVSTYGRGIWEFALAVAPDFTNVISETRRSQCSRRRPLCSMEPSRASIATTMP